MRERERERESESGVRRSRIRVAVHQASLASRCDFTRCSFPPFIEKPSPRAETSSALVGSERVRVYMYAGVCVCVCVCVCVGVNECLCIGTMFCDTHAEGQQGINGANLGSL